VAFRKRQPKQQNRNSKTPTSHTKNVYDDDQLILTTIRTQARTRAITHRTVHPHNIIIHQHHQRRHHPEHCQPHGSPTVVTTHQSTDRDDEQSVRTPTDTSDPNCGRTGRSNDKACLRWAQFSPRLSISLNWKLNRYIDPTRTRWDHLLARERLGKVSVPSIPNGLEISSRF
jgi:hypothetical protein